MLTEGRFAPGDYYARLVRVDGSVGGDAELYLDAIEHQHARRWVQSRDRDDFIAQAPHPGVVVHAAGQQGDLKSIPGDRPDGSLGGLHEHGTGQLRRGHVEE